MASLFRVKMRWDGFTGGPGLSVFHFRATPDGADIPAVAEAAVESVAIFSNQIAPLLPFQCAVQALNEVELIDEATGALQEMRVTQAKPKSLAGGTASDNYAMAAGAVITWRTGGVRNRRRVRGRTFLVPLNGTQFENNGTLRQSARDTIQTAATQLGDGPEAAQLGVYARPTPIKGADGKPTGEYNADGQWHLVTSSSVPDMGAILRSRRD